MEGQGGGWGVGGKLAQAQRQWVLGSRTEEMPIILFSKLFLKNDVQLKESQSVPSGPCWRQPVSDSHH